jgi:hypothetical protein
MAVALSPIGALKVWLWDRTSPGAGRGSFEICVLSAQSIDDRDPAEDLRLLAEELPQVPVVVVSDIRRLVAGVRRGSSRGARLLLD